MGGLFARKPADYRLLDSSTQAGGVVFWVRDAAKARDNKFINEMLTSESKRLPLSFLVALATADRDAPLTVKVIPSESETGGCEVHIDHNNPDVRITGGN